MRKHKISASILAANFLKLGEEIHDVVKAGADFIHIDVMDGAFVPNITMGVDIVKAVKSYTSVPIEAHLMVNNPEKHIEEFAKAGADTIIFHFEATTHHNKIINSIHNYGKKAGISLVPSTNEEVLGYLYEILDQVLVMTVNPGFCGQEFITNQLDKISKIKKKVERLGLVDKLKIAVDGGVNSNTSAICVNKGADILVAGSAIFSKEDYKKAISCL